ncbi:hypothetical protein ABAC460_03285 [Asticcacaulis sp. AC460]|nr:hypothetical protein ABAC460_03285 [Asticcacaulis sp. AC460]
MEMIKMKQKCQVVQIIEFKFHAKTDRHDPAWGMPEQIDFNFH